MTMRSPDDPIRPCREGDLEHILAVINDAAFTYRGVIPPDCWHDPYMDLPELKREIAAGVEFLCHAERDRITGVMGLQRVRSLWLIRHAYVGTASQRRGIGRALLDRLLQTAGRPLLVGTWRAASWAVRFYERNGFCIQDREESDRLLRSYWSISARQRETSVVLIRNRT